MFNLNFDICLVPFHAILIEITVFKLKQTFLEPPRISWKGPIKTNWITVTIFSRLLFQLVGWFDEISYSGSTLCWKKSRHERVPNHTLQHCNVVMWWQQDEAPSHTSNATMQHHRKQFPGWGMSKGDDWPWPHRSPDLTVCDLFSLGLFETLNLECATWSATT